MTMKLHIVQYESGSIPSEPYLFTSLHDAGDQIEQLIIDNTEFRSRIDNEEVEDYYKAYWEYLQNEGSEDKDTIRYWVKDWVCSGCSNDAQER